MDGCTPERTHGTPSPFMVHCKVHGKVYLSEAQYMQQLRRPDSFWICTLCGETAWWDDTNYESNIEEWEKRK